MAAVAAPPPALNGTKEPPKAPSVAAKPVEEPKAVTTASKPSDLTTYCAKAGTSPRVSGAIRVTIPKNTMAVFTCTSDADYFQSVTINPGKESNANKELKITAFRGNGRNGASMKLRNGGMQYLQTLPQAEDREVTLSFYYSRTGPEGEWEAPDVEGPRREKHCGVEHINFGSEDSINSSYNDTSLTIWLFPTGLAAAK